MSAHGKSIVEIGTTACRSLPRIKSPTLRTRLLYTRSFTDSDTATLQDGRKVGLARYGASNGPKVFYLHGSPGSRLEGKIFEPPALKLGTEIIAVDRPGIGLSSPHVNRTILDHARDVVDLATVLGYKEYYVMGIRSVFAILSCTARMQTDYEQCRRPLRPRLRSYSCVRKSSRCRGCRWDSASSLWAERHGSVESPCLQSLPIRPSLTSSRYKAHRNIAAQKIRR